MRIQKEPSGEIVIEANTGFNSKEGGWTDGIYVSLNNSSIYISFTERAVKELKEFLIKEMKDG